MTDQPGRPDDAQERLPATRPSSAPVPSARFSAPASAHRNDLTPERTGRIVRQSAKIPPHVPIHGDSRLVEDLSIDSLDLVGVLLAVQDHFDVAIEDDVVPSLQRVVDLAEYVARDRGLAAV